MINILIGVFSALGGVGILIALSKLLKREKPIYLDHRKEDVIRFDSLKKIESLREEEVKPMERDDILKELNRYRDAK